MTIFFIILIHNQIDFLLHITYIIRKYRIYKVKTYKTMNKIDINNLTGKCLISMPDASEIFSGSVIYICSHGPDGAMGFIINKRIKDFAFSDLATDLPDDIKNKNITLSLYHGGPLDSNKGFILHSDEYQINNSLNTGGGIMVSSSLEVLKDISTGTGPQKSIITLGYSGWAPNQLENEIKNNLWMVTNATPELVLGTNDEDKWSLAMSTLGISNENLTPTFGHS